jgi:hypothetical protein
MRHSCSMNHRSQSLKPVDVAVALQLTLHRERSFRGLAYAVRISTGEAHNAVCRLRAARLADDLPLVIARPQLLDFLLHGVPYAYPAEPGAETWGVPTAHSARPLTFEFPARSPLVWPCLCRTLWGRSVTPLFPAAAALVPHNPQLHRMLALVDAVRIGDPPVRDRAAAILRAWLTGPRSSRYL